MDGQTNELSDHLIVSFFSMSKFL